jgi:2-polyprenyl-3-methyl-5-hydroxy-6-metoxy-1,4-benzoquinol methylase
MRTERDRGDCVIPALLPFGFSWLPQLGLIIQRRDPQTLDWLRRVYEEDANVGYLQEGHALADAYGGEFLKFIADTVAARPARVREVVDIGCGGIYMLRRLQQAGFSVRGIDPSPVTRRQAAEAGIPILPHFYPADIAPLAADLVYHHDVLEHVDDPVAFLHAHHRDLTPGGCVVIAVPDCTENIRAGDISMLLHEHLNYFDEESLRATVLAAGFSVVSLVRSAHGGVLYCAAASGGPEPLPAVDPRKFESFRARAAALIGCFRGYVDAVLRRPGTEVGFYVPLRGIAYLGDRGFDPRIRLFDDDPGMRGKYFDGFDGAVENFADLQARPVTNMVVCSFSFGEAIAAKLRAQFGRSMEIQTFRSLLARAAVESGA